MRNQATRIARKLGLGKDRITGRLDALRAASTAVDTRREAAERKGAEDQAAWFLRTMMGKAVDTVGQPKANRYRQDHMRLGHRWQLRPREATESAAAERAVAQQMFLKHAQQALGMP
jgi:hypothetical protein